MSINLNYIPEKKLKRIIGFKKFLNFLVIFLFLFFLSKEIYNYGKNVEYYDEKNIVKYHDFGYAVYDKENKLKEVYFYEGFGSNNGFNIVSYIRKNIVLQNNEDLLVKIMKKESTWNENFIKVFGMEKQEVISMTGYKIKGLLRTDNEDQFVLSYVHNLGKNNKYCFAINTLSLEDGKNYCIEKDEGSLPMNILEYENFYFISIDKQIFVFSKKTNKIISILTGDATILGLSSNKEGDIKIKSIKGTKEVKSIIIEYYVIRKLQGDSVDLNKLIINEL